MYRLARFRTWDDRRVDSWIRVALVIVAFAPFVATLFYGYVYDDTAIILRNPVIDGWGSLLAVWKHPYWATGGNDTTGLYRPVLMLFFAIIWNAAHKFALAFHLFALMLHAGATLLVAKLLRRGTSRWPAVAGALWFAWHPVHVEAVANISNVSEVLVCVWTMLLVLWMFPSGDALDPSAAVRWRRSAVAALLFAAAVLTKESGGVAPALAFVVALAWRPLGGVSFDGAFTLARRWWRTIALCVIAIVCVALVRRAVLGGLTGVSSLAVPGLAELDAPQRIWAMLSTGGHVVQLLLWPTNQSPDYGPTSLPVGLDLALAALGTILTIALVLLWSSRLAIRSERADARPLVGVTWCLIAYVPASNLLAATGPILAERTLYLTSVGVAMMLAWCIEQGLVYARTTRASIAAPAIVGAVVIIVCIREYTNTQRYARVWRNDNALFSRMVEVDSLNYRGHQLLAIEARNRKRYDTSARFYARAYSLRPSDPTLLVNYGEYLSEMGRPRHALAIAARLLRNQETWTDPRAVTLFLNSTGRVWGVDSVLTASTRLYEREPSARAALFLGMAYEAKGDSAAARRAYRDGLRQAPADSALTARARLVGGLQR